MRRCPNCGIEIDAKKEILRVLADSDENLYIGKLLKLTGMKRSTLVYYLNVLEAKGLIERNRVEKNESGRPTYIKLKC